MYITVITKTRGEKHFRRITLEELVDAIRSGQYEKQISELRQLYSALHAYTDNDGKTQGMDNLTERIPEVCFAAEYDHYQKDVRMKAFNALVLLEVDNLPDIVSAEAIRNEAGLIPYTLCAFVGADARSVKIVCAAAMYKNAPLPAESAAMLRFQTNAYAKLHYHYSAQLNITVDKMEPRLDRSCMMSADAGIIFNPDAMSMATDDREPSLPAIKTEVPPISDYDENLLPGHDQFQSQLHSYHSCMLDAQEKCITLQDDPIYVNAVLQQLAQNCHVCGIAIGFAKKMVMLNSEMNGDEEMVNMIFREAYHKELTQTYPLKFFKPSQLVTYRTEAFLNSHYEMRLNVMTGVAQYRDKDGFNFSFQDLTEKEMNTMSIKALKSGLDSWDKDIRRYTESSLIPEYDPVNDYLDHLPAWDGVDRITPFARRVSTRLPHWEFYFRIWLRSMVAHWMGKDKIHGNSIVPLLIGKQGYGKSSFCAIILPPELRDYYNDKIDFKNETAINLGLTSFALINIDEYDALSRAQQPLLKYLLQKSDVKMRPLYGKAYEQHRRYASFIATTNNIRPLTDPTGSRRFICVYCDDIDYDETGVNYAQLYAQIKQEVDSGERYFFTPDERKEYMHHNEAYQQVRDQSEMIKILFRPASECDADEYMGVDEIIKLLQSHFPTFVPGRNTSVEVGRMLRRMGYKVKKTNKCNCYQIQEH